MGQLAITPPYRPQLAGPYDVSNFYEYPDSSVIEAKMDERIAQIALPPPVLALDSAVLFKFF
jgi:hypothetical protein